MWTGTELGMLTYNVEDPGVRSSTVASEITRNYFYDFGGFAGKNP
jgi:hypothetical protein